MPFTIKHEIRSKCDSCVHAHIIKMRALERPVTICRVLGHAVGNVEQCNQFVPPHLAPIPMHLMMNAWLLEPDKKDKSGMGFRPPVKNTDKNDEEEFFKL